MAFTGSDWQAPLWLTNSDWPVSFFVEHWLVMNNAILDESYWIILFAFVAPQEIGHL